MLKIEVYMSVIPWLFVLLSLGNKMMHFLLVMMSVFFFFPPELPSW